MNTQLSLKPLALMALWLSLASTTALAATQDLNAPIEVEAKEVEVDAQSGKSIYRGGVFLKRGSMEIRAEKMVLSQNNNKVSADLFGSSDNPATFTQLNEAGQRLSAQAEAVHYFSDQDIIEFKGNAEVKRAADVVNSDVIRYDLRQERILAGKTGGSGRVRIVIQPESTSSNPQAD